VDGLNRWIRLILTFQVQMFRLCNVYREDVELDDLPVVSPHLTRLWYFFKIKDYNSASTSTSGYIRLMITPKPFDSKPRIEERSKQEKTTLRQRKRRLSF
jgi:hypothetical protein